MEATKSRTRAKEKSVARMKPYAVELDGLHVLMVAVEQEGCGQFGRHDAVHDYAVGRRHER